MSDLREELAKRLDEVIEPWGDRLLDDSRWMKALADEVLRQMKWAQGLVEIIPDDYAEEECGCYLQTNEILSIAPPEWKP